MKTIEFRKITIKNVNGDLQETQIDYKKFADWMYFNAKKIDHLEIAREINRTGVLEYDAEKTAIIKQYTDEYFKPFILESLNPVLDKVINAKPERK